MLEAAFAGLAAVPIERFGIAGAFPRLALRPRSRDEVAQALAVAHREGLAVVPWGGGTHQHLGHAPARYDLALDLGGLARVVEHHPADLILTVEAGATLASVQTLLAEHGQFVPLEAEEPSRATIGGLLATGLAGPLRFSSGTPRDFTLWIEAVRPDGQVVRAGAKVVKNVAGYDLPKLFIGSSGTLGVITAACFKLWPMPETRWTALMGFHQLEAAEALLESLASARLAPSLVTVVKGPAGRGMPFELAPWVLAVGADGPEATTDWQVDHLLTLGREANASALLAVDGAASAEVRQALMANRGTGALRLKLNLLPDQVVGALAQVEVLSLDEALSVHAEAGNGIIRCAWERPFAGWRDVAQLAEDLGGSWVFEAGPTEWKAAAELFGPQRGDRFLMARLKATLDPRGVLNPGRLIKEGLDVRA